MKISECIKPAGVAVDLSAPSKTRLLQMLSKRAAELLDIDEGKIFAALRNRETLGSTGIGDGIAIPHAPVAGIASPFGLLVRLSRPIDFEAIDEVPVDIVCLLLTPQEDGHAHLNVLSRIAKQLRSPEIVRQIRAGTDPEQLYAAITAGDP